MTDPPISLLLPSTSFLQNIERETNDAMVILRRFLAMLRFIAELPEVLQQLDARERETLELELGKLLLLVEQFKDAIMSIGSSDKKTGWWLSRMYRIAAKKA